jgi:hypothetical protein
VAPPPPDPQVYHITHLDNLASILAAGCLWSDAEKLRQGLANTNVGMTEIKRRRLEWLRVPCHPPTFVGEYVPFYFCPRSVMLYLLHMGNHPSLTYRGGQRPILHLEADLTEVLAWADSTGRRWAFTAGNAGANYTEFHADRSELGRVDWAAVHAADFRDPAVKEGKQAEFLLHQYFPWELIRRVGVHNAGVQQQVNAILAGARHRPPVIVRPDWYY